MNKLLIFTRSYVRKDGTWDLSEETIESMISLLQNSESILWYIFISNYNMKNTESEANKRLNNFMSDYRVRDKVGKFITIETHREPKSCSEARLHLYSRILSYPKTGSGLADFYMNLDSDDTIANPEALIAFTEGKKVEDDLVGFGLDFTGGEPFSKEWDFNYEKFIYSRRYVTTETQTMFLFLHNIKVIEYAMYHYDNKIGYLKSEPVGSPNESCDDTLMALEVAEYNKSHPDSPFKIGALCANLINYHIHPGQVSENQQSEYKNSIKSKLWELGYLYVNSGNFYLPVDGVIEKFNPYDIAKLRNIIK